MALLFNFSQGIEYVSVVLFEPAQRLYNSSTTIPYIYVTILFFRFARVLAYTFKFIPKITIRVWADLFLLLLFCMYHRCSCMHCTKRAKCTKSIAAEWLSWTSLLMLALWLYLFYDSFISFSNMSGGCGRVEWIANYADTFHPHDIFHLKRYQKSSCNRKMSKNAKSFWKMLKVIRLI